MALLHNRQENKFVAICDECDCVIDLDDAETFAEAKDAIDIDGLLTYKDNGKWKNSCPDCC